MKQYALLRKYLDPVKYTPLHPQWFVYKDERRIRREIGLVCRGRVLDVGAGTQAIRHYIGVECQYISLDYYQTATEWYHTRPQLFGDGQRLPIKSDSIDTILLLDVLEHIPQTHDCLAEVTRVLKSDGKLIIHVPFLYPLHDVPYDFYRWTRYGLSELADQHEFQIKSETSLGAAVETATLLINLALSKTILNWFKKKNPLFLLVIFLPFIVLFFNLIAWIFLHLSKDDGFMPKSYLLVWAKQG